MLVLTRHVGEQVVINGNIIVEVVEIRGDKIRLGFAAPAEIPIHRAEIQDLLHREGREFVRHKQKGDHG